MQQLISQLCWVKLWRMSVCLRVSSHLSFLLDFKELCHIREIFLVGFSHLLLCSLWVHDLQSLQTRSEWLSRTELVCGSEVNGHTEQHHFTWRGVNATLELVPEERSLTVDFPPYVMLCFCNALCWDVIYYRLKAIQSAVEWRWGVKKKSSVCSPEVIWRS